jgi:cyclophilin family peptidyl-prolyl cis-trans isomerase
MKFRVYLTLLTGLMSLSQVSCANSEPTDTTANPTSEAKVDEANLTENEVIASSDATIEDLNYEMPLASASGSTIIKMKTTLGDVKFMLYDDTPLHRDNFIKLVKEKFYDGILFHRVIKDFMIQAGDPNSKTAKAGQQLGDGGPGYTIPAEIKSGLYHKKGALSAARQGDQVNPKKESSGSQFYIVTGKVTPQSQLKSMSEQQNKQLEDQKVGAFLQDPKNASYTKKYQELQALYQTNVPENQQKAETEFATLLEEIRPLALKGFVPATYTDEQLKIYESIGGTPFLDNNYTVFGEVTEGLDIVDKIGLVKTAPGDRPLEDVKIISMEIVKK